MPVQWPGINEVVEQGPGAGETLTMACSLGKLSNPKSGETWELVQIRGGGRQKIKKVPSFSWEKFKIRGGGLRKSKKSQVPEGIRD